MMRKLDLHTTSSRTLMNNSSQKTMKKHFTSGG